MTWTEFGTALDSPAQSHGIERQLKRKNTCKLTRSYCCGDEWFVAVTQWGMEEEIHLAVHIDTCPLAMFDWVEQAGGELEIRIIKFGACHALPGERRYLLHDCKVEFFEPVGVEKPSLDTLIYNLSDPVLERHGYVELQLEACFFERDEGPYLFKARRVPVTGGAAAPGEPWLLLCSLDELGPVWPATWGSRKEKVWHPAPASQFHTVQFDRLYNSEGAPGHTPLVRVVRFLHRNLLATAHLL